MAKRWISLLLTAVMLAGIPLTVNAEAPPEEIPAVLEDAGDPSDSAVQPEAEPDGEPGDEPGTEPDDTDGDTPGTAPDGEPGSESDTASDVAEPGTPTDLPEPEPAELETFDDYDAAADNAAGDSGDIFGALGLSTTGPGTAALEKRKNNPPYGEKFTMTVNELFQGGYLYGDTANYLTRLIGHQSQGSNSLSKQFTQPQTDSTPMFGDVVNSFQNDETATAYEADFDGDGRRSQVVTLRSSWDRTSISISVGEAADVATDSFVSRVIRVDNLSSLKDDFRYTEYNKHDLNLAIGDINDDGYDEIVYLLPNVKSTSEPETRLRVMSLIDPASKPDWGLASSWALRDYIIGDGFGGIDTATAAHRRAQSLAVGDLDGDGKDDIAVAGSWLVAHFTDSQQSYARAQLDIFYGKDFTAGATNPSETYKYDSRNPGASTLFGANGLMQLPTPADIRLDKDSINTEMGVANTITFSTLLPMQLGLDIVDAGGGSGKELLLGYDYFVAVNRKHSETDIRAKCNPDSGYQVEPLRFDSSKRKITKVGSSMPSIQMSAFTAMLQCNIPYLEAQNNFFGSLWGNDTVSTVMKTTQPNTGNEPIQLTAARMNAALGDATIIVGLNQHVLENGKYVLKTAFANKGEARLYPYPANQISTSGNINLRIGYQVYDIRPAVLSSVENGAQTMHYGFVVQYTCGYSHFPAYVLTEFVSGNYTACQNPEFSITPYAGCDMTSTLGAIFCLPDTDLDSPTLIYKGYDYLYSDPTVVAAIAAPPYVKDIAELDDNYIGNFSTGYSFSIGNGTGTTSSYGTNLGGYLSASAEIGVVAKGVVEFEFEYNHNWNEEAEKVQEVTQTVGFTAQEKDVVAVLSYPMDVYSYTMEYPVDSTGTTTAVTDLVMRAPYTPVHNTLPLDEYDAAYQRFPEGLPNIAGEVFTHEPGYPDTYNYNAANYNNAWVSKNSAGFSTTGGIQLELEKNETDSITTTSSNSVDFKLGGGAKFGAFVEAQITVGGTKGTEWGEGSIVTSSRGVAYNVEVGGHPSHAYLPYRNISYNLLQYNYTGVQNFPVVTYQVNMQQTENGYPYQPEEYGVDNSLSTDNQLGIYWAPSRDDITPGTGSNLSYTVFSRNVNESAGPVAVAGTPSYDPLTERYVLLDTGLAPGATYEYYVVCLYKDNTTIVDAFHTAAFRGTTNKDKLHNYSFTTPLPEQLTISPGTPASATAVFANGELEASAVRYTWQKMSQSKWYNLSDTGSSITFDNPVPGNAGHYRLMAVYAGKSYFSDAMVVSFVPNDTVVSLRVSPETLAGATTEMTATATVTTTDGRAVPDDTMMAFTLTRPDGSSLLQTAVVCGGVASATLKTDKAGTYTVSATYQGNGQYASSHSDTVQRNKSDKSRWTYSIPMTQTQFNYGDTFKISMTAYAPDTGKPQPGVPVILVQKYENGRWSDTPLSGWVQGSVGHGVFERDVIMKDTGRYRLRITAWLAESNDSGPVWYEFNVKPRPVSYTIGDLTLYADATATDIPNMWTIACTSGSTVAGERTYTTDDLILTDTFGNEIPDLEGLAPGTYYIRIAKAKAITNPLYDIKVRQGVLTISEIPLDQLAQVTLGASPLGSIRAVNPSLPDGGGRIPKNRSLTLEAVPEKSYYEFKGWVFDPPQDPSNLTEKGKRVTIKQVTGDLTVEALFEAAPIVVSPAGAQVSRGAQQAFRATLPTGLTGEVEWSVQGNRSAATAIDADGVLSVSATEGAKTLTVTATSVEDGAVKGSVDLTVTQPDQTFVVRDADGREYSDLMLAVGETRSFTVQPVPADSTPGQLTVSSSKKSVATAQADRQPETGADGSFTVKGVKTGLTTLTIELEIGEETITRPLTVWVMKDKIDDVTAVLNKETATLEVDKTLKLTPAFTPAKTPLASVSWASEDEAVARVDDTGKVTAVAPHPEGKPVAITMTARAWGVDKAITATCAVTVTAPARAVKITGAEGADLPRTIVLAAKKVDGEPPYDTTIQLEAVLTPVSSTDPVKWSSSNPAVATVDEATGLVSAAGKAGSAVITATAGGKKASCKLSVIMPVPKDGVGLDATELALQVGRSATLRATVSGSTAADTPTNQKLVWTSSDPSVATVGTSGKVTAKRSGTAVVRATSAENPASYKDCTVTVAAPVTAMAFNQKTFTLKTGASTTLSLTFNNGKGVTGLEKVTLTSSNAALLAFTGDGASADGASLTLSTPTDLVNLTAGASLTGAKTTETVTITAETVRPGSTRPLKATLKIKVTSLDTVAAESVALTAASAKKAPGTGGHLEDSPAAPLAVGASFKPAVSFKPAKVSDKNMTWTLSAERLGASADPLAYVDFDAGTGKVTARRACDSTTVLTLEGVAHGSGAEGVRIQFQTAARVRKLSIKPVANASTTLEPGSHLQVLSVIDPGDARHSNLRWTSSDDTVVAIESDDVGQSVTVRALKPGKVALRAVAMDGSKKSASIKLTVHQPVKDIVITNKAADGQDAPATWTLAQGKTLKLKAGLNLANQLDNSSGSAVLVNDHPAPSSKAVTWRLLSGEGVVSLNAKTGVVKGLAYGTALIEAVPVGAEAGSYSTSATIYQPDGASEIYCNTILVTVDAAAKSVKINQSGFSVYGDGRTLTLSAAPAPALESLSPGARALVWSIPKNLGLDFDMSQPAMAAGGTAGESEDGKNLTYTTHGGMTEVMLKANAVEAAAKIKVTVTTSSNKTASVTLTLAAAPEKAPAVRGVSLGQSAVWLQTGKSTKLSAGVTPGDAGNKNLSWAIEEYTVDGRKLPEDMAGSVAVVDATGKVTAKGTGYAVVTVSSMDGGHKAACTVYCVARG